MNHFNNEVINVNGTEYMDIDLSFIRMVEINDEVSLIRECDNINDSNAIMVFCRGR